MFDTTILSQFQYLVPKMLDSTRKE